MEPETMKIKKNKLKQIIREALMREEASGQVPSVDSLAQKLSAAGPAAAMEFMQNLMMKLSFSSSTAPAPMLIDPADEEIDIDLDVEDEAR